MKTNARLCAALMACWIVEAAGQGFPARPVRVVIPFAPGGVSDFVLRAVADPVGAALGQPLVADNRAGGGGTVAADHVARAAPDGYTLMLGTGGNLAMAPSLFKALPYDPQKDFTPLALIARGQFVLLAHPSVPAASPRELIALARKGDAAAIRYGSSGIGAPPHLAAELFKSLARIDMLHVPYKGSAPMLTDLVGGHIDVGFDSIATALPHVRGGRLRALAVSGEKRSLTVPELPTIGESGLPGFRLSSFYAFVAPAGTNAAASERLAQEILKAGASPAVAKRLVDVGLDPDPQGGDRLAELLRSERSAWAGIVREAGITPQ